jgi:hypothetical protein
VAAGVEHGLSDPVPRELDRLLWAFPDKSVTARHRDGLARLLGHVLRYCIAEQVEREIPPTLARKRSLAYIHELRPPSFRAFSDVVLRAHVYHPEKVATYTTLYRTILPVVRSALRQFRDDGLEDLAIQEGEDPGRVLAELLQDLLTRGLGEQHLGWYSTVIASARTNLGRLFYEQDQCRRAFDIARDLAARATGLSTPARRLRKAQLARLLRQGKRQPWRIREWEAPEARKIADQIIAARA